MVWPSRQNLRRKRRARIRESLVPLTGKSNGFSPFQHPSIGARKKEACKVIRQRLATDAASITHGEDWT